MHGHGSSSEEDTGDREVLGAIPVLNTLTSVCLQQLAGAVQAAGRGNDSRKEATGGKDETNGAGLLDNVADNPMRTSLGAQTSCPWRRFKKRKIQLRSESIYCVQLMIGLRYIWMMVRAWESPRGKGYICKEARPAKSTGTQKETRCDSRRITHCRVGDSQCQFGALRPRAVQLNAESAPPPSASC